MKSDSFQRSFLLILVAVISAAFLWMIKSFLITLLLAAIFSSLARPLYLKFVGWTKGRKKLSSALAILGFVFVIILPAFGFLGIVANEAVKVTENVKPWLDDNLSNKEDIDQNLRRLPFYNQIVPYRQQIVTKVSSGVNSLGNFIFTRVSAFTAGTLLFFVDFAIMLYAMFFFFLNGPAILNKILYYMPLHSKDEKKLLDGFRSMARATIKGLVVIGIVQGSLAGLALWVAGVPSPLFWGTVMAVLSIVPNIGSALIWVPACIYLFVKGQTIAGIMVFLWCALIVGSADNFLRPVLVGKDTEVPELMVLLSTLGGLTMLGMEGFILGPMLALLFLTIWDIYGATFKDILPKAGDL